MEEPPGEFSLFPGGFETPDPGERGTDPPPEAPRRPEEPPPLEPIPEEPRRGRRRALFGPETPEAEVLGPRTGPRSPTRGRGLFDPPSPEEEEEFEPEREGPRVHPGLRGLFPPLPKRLPPPRRRKTPLPGRSRPGELPPGRLPPEAPPPAVTPVPPRARGLRTRPGGAPTRTPPEQVDPGPMGFVIRPDTPEQTPPRLRSPIFIRGEPTWEKYAAMVIEVETIDLKEIERHFTSLLEDQASAVGRPGRVLRLDPSPSEVSLVQVFKDLDKSISEGVDILFLGQGFLQGRYEPHYLKAQVTKTKARGGTPSVFGIRMRVKEPSRADTNKPEGDVKISIQTVLPREAALIDALQSLKKKNFAGSMRPKITHSTAMRRIGTNINEIVGDPFPSVEEEFKMPIYFVQKIGKMSDQLRTLLDAGDDVSIASDKLYEAVGVYSSLVQTIVAVEKQVHEMKAFFYEGMYPARPMMEQSMTCSVFPKEPRSFRRKIDLFERTLVKYRGVADAFVRVRKASEKKC